MPHGFCYMWDPGVVWLHVVSDALITLAYLSIPITLIHFVRKRRDLPFHWMFLCFGVFIVACGTTHAMEIWNLWHADYWLSGAVKAVTAAASIPTAILLARLVPKALTLPSVSDLINANHALERQIMERERAEEAVRRSEEKYRRFFASNLAGSFVCDPNGQILECNPAYARMLGFASIEEALQYNFSSLHTESKSQKILSDTVKNEGKVEQSEVELRRHDGRSLHAVESAIGVFDESGRLIHIFGYLIDETERRKAEEHLRQEQKMSALGLLAGGISHDFNNILGVIMGYADIVLARVKQGDPLEKCAKQISEAAERGAALTKQLLACSRQQVISSSVLELNKVITDFGAMLTRIIGEDIELTISPAADSGRVKADQSQIEQVLLNLAINARDAMPKGGRLVIESRNVVLGESYVGRHPVVPPGEYVMVAVSDTGVGMDESTRDQIFQPFFSTKEFGKGTGLGLAIVYGIVKQSDGFIWVYSELGVGTTFKVYLPRVREETSRTVEAKHGPQRTFEGGETILLAEDEEDLREVERLYLESQGYTVLTASNGIEALRLAEEYEGNIDLLLTDVIMPQMGGRELAERLVSSRDTLQVILASGYTNRAIAPEGLSEAGFHFLQKPFSLSVLGSKVRDAMDRT